MSENPTQDDRRADPVAEPLRICCVSVSPAIRSALADQGHEVLHLAPLPGASPHLPALLDQAGFQPDAILQQEILLPRVLLAGLGELDCIKAFWAVDPHLNAFWQSCYSRLFDVVFSTQRRWLPDLARHGAPNVVRLPWYARAGEWHPWAERETPLAFVGRVTPERPARMRFVHILKERFGPDFVHAQDLDPAGMARLYAQTRIVPNESILGEVNFRLFEAARFGCLVAGQNLGPEQDELFEPGRETLCYGDALELLELLDFYLAHERQATAVARAGWERLRAEHQPEHRAATLVRALRDAPLVAAKGREADAWLAAAAAQLRRAGRLDADLEPILAALRRNEAEPACCALRLRLLAEEGKQDDLAAELHGLLAQGVHAASLEVNAAASLAARSAGLPDYARAFWLRHAQGQMRNGRTHRPAETDAGANLVRLWAGALRKAGVAVNAGFVFHEQRHVPSSAADCLALALLEAPADLDLVRQTDALFASLPGQEHARLGLLSTLTLHRREDWRLGLEAGLVNLRAFRIEAGREELQLALKLARAQGAEARLLSALAGRDPSGRIRRLLES
ncbi:glycosyltransferase [Paucidesulfovibrio longus]|uniref:glycosyltransferase n=1 Tax=Paucidesulfovibrio longus TaxID=889 RepID=UPI0003B6EFB0|nr:glycosyltransferase [Paucidesulfovibrio longus]